MKIHIIGMGIVGSYAALKMARDGHDVTVYEPSMNDVDVIYGSHFPTAHIQEIMSLLSLNELDGLQTDFQIVYMCDGVELLRIDSHDNESTLIPQQTLTKLMREMCGTMENVTVVEQSVVTIDAEQSTLILADGCVQMFELAIVCTGARSDLRMQLDAKPSVTRLSKWRVHDLYGKNIRRDDMIWDISSRPSMTVSLDADHLRYEYLVTNDLHAHGSERSLPVSPHRIKNHQTRTYTVTSSRCKQYHRNNVLFAGDFAHTVEPFQGIGISEGLLDINYISSALCNSRPLETLGREYTKYVAKRLFQTHLKTRVLYLIIHVAYFTGSNRLTLALARTFGRCFQSFLRHNVQSVHKSDIPHDSHVESVHLLQQKI